MKFAYLIMAHNEPYVLQKLLTMLDYPENDLFLHIDKKSKDINSASLLVRNANLTIIPSISVTWGGYSQIDVELRLIQEAAKERHDYYHLISGQDLPTKSQQYFQDFFSDHYGNEFIGASSEWGNSPEVAARYNLYWFFQDRIGKNGNVLSFLSRLLLKEQRVLKVNRNRKDQTIFYGGPNWFSITQESVDLILSRKNWIENRFRSTLCCDEIFAATIIGNSDRKEKIWKFETGDTHLEAMRFAGFKEGGGASPKILDEADYEAIIKCYASHEMTIRRSD